MVAFEVRVSGAGNTEVHVEAAWIFGDGEVPAWSAAVPVWGPC